MKKLVIDLRNAQTPAKLHDQLAQEFDFPAYYGRNLDALYDMLTDICEDTCAGVFLPENAEEMQEYVERVCHVMSDASADNPHLAIFVLKNENG